MYILGLRMVKFFFRAMESFMNYYEQKETKLTTTTTTTITIVVQLHVAVSLIGTKLLQVLLAERGVYDNYTLNLFTSTHPDSRAIGVLI